MHTWLAALLFLSSAIFTTLAAGIFHKEPSTINGTSHELQRRWYSYQRIDKPPAPWTQWYGPWPWNEKCKKYLITYCFKNQQAMNAMHYNFLVGIGTWSPAIDQSGLAIEPDPSCSDTQCLCGPDTLADTLEVGVDIGFHASTGHIYGSKEKGRHNLHGKAWDLKNQEGIKSEYEFQNYVAYNIAHELGHVFGFFHEHQRPDAARYVKFHCENIAGYAVTLASIKDVKDPAFAANDTPKQKMDKICSDIKLARRHFPAATAWIPGGDPLGEKPLTEGYNPPFVAGTEFDYKSIMIYGSVTGAADEDWQKTSAWTITTVTKQKPPPGLPWLGNAILDGGHLNYGDKEISSGDVERLLQLYPKGGPPKAKAGSGKSQKRKAKDADEPWAPVKFVVPGVLTTTVSYGPVSLIGTSTAHPSRASNFSWPNGTEPI